MRFDISCTGRCGLRLGRLLIGIAVFVTASRLIEQVAFGERPRLRGQDLVYRWQDAPPWQAETGQIDDLEAGKDRFLTSADGLTRGPICSVRPLSRLEGYDYAISSLRGVTLVQSPKPNNLIRYLPDAANDDRTFPATPLQIHDTCEDNRGRLWVATTCGVYRLSRGTWQVLRTVAEPDQRMRHWQFNSMRALFADGERGVYVGCHGGGLLHVDFSDDSASVLLSTDDPNQAVVDFAGEPGGVFWAAVQGVGVASASGSDWRCMLGPTRWMPSTTIFAMECDQEGNLWIATDRGVGVRHRNGESNITNDTQILPSQRCCNLAVTPGGDVWISTDKGFAIRHPNGTWAYPRIPMSERFRDQPAGALRVESSDRIWIGCHSGLLFAATTALATEQQ